MRRTISSRSRSASFDRAQVLDAIRRAFAGRAPSGARRDRRPEPPPARAAQRRVLARPFERASVEIAYPGVALSHPDAPYLDLVAFLLGNCESSRLVRAVKERDALVDRIDAWSYTPLDPGTTAIDFDTDTPRDRGSARGDRRRGRAAARAARVARTSSRRRASTS